MNYGKSDYTLLKEFFKKLTCRPCYFTHKTPKTIENEKVLMNAERTGRRLSQDSQLTNFDCLFLTEGQSHVTSQDCGQLCQM